MELDIAVGEPDVGSLRAGQVVSFSVLAYPNRIFYSSVNEVRQNPTIINNVTTYDTVAYPSNDDGALRPGMTANVQIVVASYDRATYVASLGAPMAAKRSNHSKVPDQRAGIGRRDPSRAVPGGELRTAPTPLRFRSAVQLIVTSRVGTRCAESTSQYLPLMAPSSECGSNPACSIVTNASSLTKPSRVLPDPKRRDTYSTDP